MYLFYCLLINLLFSFSNTVFACAVCFVNDDGKSAKAYIITTFVLMGILFGIAYAVYSYIKKRIKAAEEQNEQLE